MRCKKHYTDLSSTIGVCSCCLRERLIDLIAIQEQQNQTLETLKHHNSVKIQRPSHLTSRKSDYSDLPRHHHHSHSDQLFYTAPQVAATASTAPKKRSSIKRFLTFQNIFRSKHKNEDDATATSSWISSIWHRRKKTVHVDESVMTAPVTRRYCRDRGMSPARNSDEEGGACDESATESWKNTPRRNNNGKRGHVRNGSGLTFCVSPYLVRPSPNRDANLMNTKSFCANRSRKLADFGRPSLNR